MKRLILINFLLLASMSIAQTKIITTEDGKKLLLKEDNTFEYVNDQNSANSCIIDSDFVEPKWNSSKVRTRNKTKVNDLKKVVSKDTGIGIDKITILSFSEETGSGDYLLCVNGQKMKYVRRGNEFLKDK